ncbi:WD40-repeat-containing domain protein [Chiua virens]|nr:WD40-repeat-containing domain protein [Chiua virens]
MASPTSPRSPDPAHDIAGRSIGRAPQSCTSDHRRHTSVGKSSSTVYIPTASPPTPAPSPAPASLFADAFHLCNAQGGSYDPANLSRIEFANLIALGPTSRKRYLVSLLNDCTPSELLFISQIIAPMLRRDFLAELPPELALHILSFVDDPKTLARASQVSKRWHDLVQDEWLWKTMCGTYRFHLKIDYPDETEVSDEVAEESSKDPDSFPAHPMDPALQTLTARESLKRQELFPLSSWRQTLSNKCTSEDASLSYRKHFEYSYTLMSNMRRGGYLLRSHRMPIATPDGGVVTSVALDSDRIVVGCANSKVHIYSANTGVLCRTLMGHDQGVWAVHLVSRGGYWDEPEDHTQVHGDESPASSSAPLTNGCVHLKYRRALGFDMPKKRPPRMTPRSEGPGKPSDLCCTSEGWGQPNPIVVSAGCDKSLRVWDVVSGHCIYILRGHAATIRCARVLHNRPIAVTGSRDTTVRVWDIQQGRMLRILQGHSNSVRCLDVCGNMVVSGSYDRSCRIWSVDTGECLHVLTGHEQEIYSVAFDGIRVVSGGMDTTVRVWDAMSGQCMALLQGHTALVCQLQLCPTTGLLATGGSDGRVITFDLRNFTSLQRISAHDSSVTSLQFDSNFLITGGNDGRVRMYETQSGAAVRDLSERCESVWKVACKGGTCAIMCKRSGKMVIEIWSFRPRTLHL